MHEYEKVLIYARQYLSTLRRHKKKEDRTAEALIRAEMFLEQWREAETDLNSFGSRFSIKPSESLITLVDVHKTGNWLSAQRRCNELIAQARSDPGRTLYEYWDIDLDLFAKLAESQGRHAVSKALTEQAVEMRRQAKKAIEYGHLDS
jgi:hypothetical protein